MGSWLAGGRLIVARSLEKVSLKHQAHSLELQHRLQMFAVSSQVSRTASINLLSDEVCCVLASCCRYGKPLADGLEWPSDAEAVGGLIRGKVQEMVADTRELAAAFAAAAVAAHMPRAPSMPAAAAAPAAVAAAGEGAAEREDSKGEGEDSAGAQQQQQLPQEVLQQRAEAATAEVNADCQMALTHVRDSHGKLLYVVLLASLHRAGKEVPAEQQEKQQQEEQAAKAQEQSQPAGEKQTQQKDD